MKILEYPSYDDYLDAQKDVTRGKLRRRIQYVDQPSCKRIARWLRPHLDDGDILVCHGARSGQEVEWLGRALKGVGVIGTDLLLPGESEHMVEHDYNRPLPEHFPTPAAIYSNSLDHSPDPAATLAVWAGDLAPGGVLAVQWGYATHDERHVKGADCFGASHREYGALIRSVPGVAWVRDRSWINTRNRRQVLFIAGKEA